MAVDAEEGAPQALRVEVLATPLTKSRATRNLARNAAARVGLVAAYRYVVVDVFTDTPLQGNPLAVFTDAAGFPRS